ncbi:uncharacterized protein LOC132703394 [Cylas formicarius]|uniref:uncharacterized protein LOC132703394 n=1 Tax=Cylas formicarius TaxID=197179 RepID=UPI0029589C5D|nr:uncharacterized protein LOC132703394 [Cylas formicarius]
MKLFYRAAMISVTLRLTFSIPIKRNSSAIDARGVPLYAPNVCPENELLYPGETTSDWICDCGPGYLYYASKEGCFAAYRQGPCSDGNYLVFNSSNRSAVCSQTSCQDGFARYEDKCYELGKPNGPCPPINQGGGIFDVNVTTLVVECLRGTENLSLLNLPSRCSPGSRRDSSGNCRVVYK